MNIEIVGTPPFPIQRSQTILNAAIENNVPIFHTCGGKGDCTTCRVVVIEGSENLSPSSDREEWLRERGRLPLNVRLACQTQQTKGSAKVQRIIRDDDDVGFYLGAQSIDAESEIGSERMLSLFFIDIKDFTPFSEQSLAFDVVHVLRRLFRLFYDAIGYYKGDVIETNGDGLYAVFGLDGTNTIQSASNAVKAGFRILDELRRQNQTYFKPFFNYLFEAGIGIHSGKVIVGNIYSCSKDITSVMGYNVSIASRLQSITRTLNNNFIISKDVFHALEFNTEYSTRVVNLKGVRESLDVYLLGMPFVNSSTGKPAGH
ncbi:adenylate/guanylate cyclase domain-containing protein [Chryseolinea sp. T2]|uniref:adenylate/guanylate cyclase domain-containing protein n=1 Tax=Chryseolinea sp. T2 TaxID=3129255 RepID=UPI0030773A70